MIFLDSSFLIALFSQNDQWHEKAKKLYQKISDSEFMITDHIISETVTMIGNKSGVLASFEVYNFLISNLEVYPTSRKLYNKCMDYHITYNGKLSFVDCLSVAVMEKEKIYEIASFDSDFDKVIGIFRLY